MQNLPESIKVILKNPVKYHKNGEIEYSHELTLFAPTGSHRRELVKLKQYFIKAIKSLQGTDKADKSSSDDGQLTAESISYVFMFSDIDFNEIIDTFESLITKGLCNVDDNQKMTSSIYKNIMPDDLEKIIGEYLLVFLLSSTMNNLKKT